MNKLNIKAIIVSVIISLSLMLSSCSDWLNVQPSNQVAAEEQFSKEDGFKTALSGVYTLLSQSELYGREMTFGTMDYLGQYWNAIPSSFYEEVPAYKYEEQRVINFIDPLWSKMYNAIANINDLLAFIDVNRKVFLSEESYSIIKGEALALRAYAHLDILRMFAPNNFGEDANTEKWLPYVDEYTLTTKLSLTNDEFVEKIIEDLEAATELLKYDPIYTGAENSDIYFKNRHFHMNYYAARALMARTYMYINEKDKAELAAKEVVDAQQLKKLFRWITTDEVTLTNDDNRDRTFSTEHIFALNVNRLDDNIVNYFTSTSTPLIFRNANIFEGNTEYRSIFVSAENVSTKFAQPEDVESDFKHVLKRMPLLRISEMYYILAECTEDISYVETVRANRGIFGGLTISLQDALTAEYEKEFIGEGQYFFYHKRLGSEKIGSERPRYTLVMPNDEINFGGRPRPTE